ncbi:MAG: endonuclease/exonuclease/phosphatase family protein [Cellulosilyticaceae bacterium]
MNELKVMSFNMKRDCFPIGRRNFNRRKFVIKEIIDKYKPDIIGTQELTASGIKEFKRLLEGYQCVGSGRDGAEKGEYTAIFYLKNKFEMNEESTFWLSPTPEKPSRAWFAMFPRICTTCTLRIKEKPEIGIRLYNTHLDHISYWARIKGLYLITKSIQAAEREDRKPTLIMGDFNATPTSRTMKVWENSLLKKEKKKLASAYTQLENEPVGRSYHYFSGKKEGHPIDYIYVTEDIQVQQVQLCYDTVEGHFPSDHYPVLATLQIQ